MFAFINGNNNNNSNSDFNENGKIITELLEQKLKSGLISKFSVGLTYETETFPIPNFFVIIYPVKRMEGTLISAPSISRLAKAVENFFNDPQITGYQ